MTNHEASRRRSVGEQLAPIQLTTLAHGTLSLPAATNVHLQFRRFAGCPVCNLHLRRFAEGQARLEAAGVRTIAFFHSPAELMQPYQGALPFPTVPDPERRWYRHFGVERTALAVVHPQVMWSALRGLVGAPSNPFAGGSDQSGLPADILINPSGTIIAVHYGKHADDQWSLDEVISLNLAAAQQANPLPVAVLTP
jgi:peroxiredoxin